MSPSRTSRHRRVARTVAMSAAALAVSILPTACDYPGLPGTDAPGAPAGGGHSGHHGQGAPVTSALIVPVGDTSDATETSTDSADPTEDQDGDEATETGDATRTTDASETDETPDTADATTTTEAPRTTEPPATAAPPAAPQNNGLDVLGRDCSDSDLEPHDGFQEAPRCVDTAFGEVASQDQSPSLLITEAPTTVAQQTDFTISVSTRNLVRDRFLGAAAGGYYLESSFLDQNGLQRGHFHTACRMLESTAVAPDAAPAPQFFLATQDNGGGAEPDTVDITVKGGMPAGTAQCAVWAGDGSHRLPMMQRANQTPAFDAVRITVE